MALISTVGVFACSAAGTGDEPTSSSCEPGQTISCACTNGSMGLQMCTQAGSFTACDGCGMMATNTGTPLPSTSPTTTPTTTSPTPVGPAPTEPLPTAPIPTEPIPTEPVPTQPIPTEPVPVEPPPVEPDPVEPVPGASLVPATQYCAPVADWDPLWTEWEDEVLRLVNERRALGASCGSEGSFPPAAPLTMNPTLRCSSRLHSEDMFVRDYFSHTNPDGLDPFERMAAAGYAGGTQGENIAWGQSSPQEVVDGWMGSDGHCANIMRSGFTEIGVGYYPGDQSNPWGSSNYWTQNFGGPGWRG